MKIVILDGYTENPGDLSWGELETVSYTHLDVYKRQGHAIGPDGIPLLFQQPGQLCLPAVAADQAKGLVHPAFPLMPWYAAQGRR